jgi:hypothetical protein
METVGNAMLLISAAMMLLLFVCLFFAGLEPESKKQDNQELNNEVEALKNTCFEHIAEIEVRLNKLESEVEENG